MKRTLTACLVLAAAFAPGAIAGMGEAASQPVPDAAAVTRVPFDLSSRLAEICKTGGANVPGITAIMIDRNGVIARGAAGLRRAGGTTPVTIDDKWHLGSCTKAMTGTLCALLVNDGTLRWDSTIGDVFNPLRDEKSKITNNWRLVTLRQLTTCTGNVPSDLGEWGGRPLWSNLWEKARHGTPPQEQRAYLFSELIRGNIATPSTSFQYANASVALAGYMAETAAKTPYEDLIRTRLFGPLGMTSAGFGAPGTAVGGSDAEAEDQPWGHTAKGKPMRPGINADNPAAITPAGTVHMSIDDWGRFARLHLIGAELTLPHDIDWSADEPEPQWDKATTLGLGPADFAVLHGQSSERYDYAAGWIVTNRPAWAKGDQPGASGRCLTHTGSNTMWTAAIWIAPEIDRAFLAIVNSGSDAAGEAREQALQAMIALDRQWRGLPPAK
jgi:CubicO group peptidase (beta-lactamase class C family)